MVKHTPQPRPSRRGGVYIAVLAVSAMVAAMGVGLLYAVRLQGRSDALVADSAQARACAQSGIDAVAQYIASNANWRTRAPGAWFTDTPLGRGLVTVEVTDPIDGSLANDASQAILIKATGRAGGATHILSVTASPRGTAISSLSMAMACQGQFHVEGGKILNANGATVHTNTQLKNEGTIQGAARCATVDGSSVATQGTTTGAAALQLPSTSVLSAYTARGTVVTPASTTIQDVVLTPSFNSLGGGLNADGVYVINTSSDLTIRSIRLLGTLVVNNPGKKVTIEGPALMQPARDDFPTLIASGAIVYKSSGLTQLSEAVEACNFNPLGSPYAGDADSDMLDSYPSRFEGLMHALEAIELDNNAVIHGCVLTNSAALSDALRIRNNISVTHMPALAANPPIDYTVGGVPAIVPGSWRQLVNP